MIVDFFASAFVVALINDTVGKAIPAIRGYGWEILMVVWAIFFIMWIRGVVRLAKNESKGGMIAVLLVGLFLSTFFGWIISMFISSDKKKSIERERERERAKILGTSHHRKTSPTLLLLQ